MEIKLHKTIDIRIKDVNNFEEAENRVNQVLDSLRTQILQEVEDVLTREAEGC